jgi:hypothetical protein
MSDGGLQKELRMAKQSGKQFSVTVLVVLLLSLNAVLAQEPALKITRPAGLEKSQNSNTLTAELERQSAFRRLAGEAGLATQGLRKNRATSGKQAVWEKGFQVASVAVLQSLGAGGGDVNELEPNNQIAQSVSLPVNLFGRIGFDSDVDYFSFQAFAGQQIVVEPFATRLSSSDLIADVALFNAAGQLLKRSFGDEREDPLLTYTPLEDQILIAGIADVDDFGGSSYNYVLNITRGVDVDELEPNDRTSQELPALPVTVFGDINKRPDVDFYSFNATAGQTLIVDVDAQVFGSLLDAEINLTDPATGLEYFYNDQLDGDDPRFNILLPFTGRYVIGIGSFASNSRGFYRLNATLVTQTGAPLITRVTRLAKKLVEVEGTGLSSATIIEVNGVVRNTSTISANVLRAKGKIRAGDVVTVINPPDSLRSNPLLVQ